MSELVLMPDDLPTTLAEAGLTLGRVSDDEVWALCPAHLRRSGKEDTAPTNFSVNMDTGVSHCFACGYSAGLTSLIAMVLFDNDAWAASGWLAERGASLVDAIARVKRKNVAAKRMAGIALNDPDFEFVVFPEAPDYALEDRDLSRESAHVYRVRWDERSQNWVLPFIGENGRVVGWQTKGKRRFVNYPTGLQKSDYLFGLDKTMGSSRAILVESPLDVLRLYTAGYPYAVSSYGSEVSDTQVSLLLRAFRHITLAMDNDEAGAKSTTSLLERLGGRIPVNVLSYRHTAANDPGEMTDDEVVVAMDNAVPAPLYRRLGH